MNDKKYYLPLMDDEFINYQPNSKLINAYLNTIELSAYIKAKENNGYNITYQVENDEEYRTFDFFTEKITQIRYIFNEYYSIFSNPQITSHNVSDYFKIYFEAIENFTDLLFFINASSYDSEIKYECVQYKESKKMKMLLFDKFRFEFEYTAINLDNSLMDILDNKQNIKFIRICNSRKELVSFIQGCEPEFNDMASIVLFKNIMQSACTDLKNLLEDIFTEALNFYNISNKDCAFESLFLYEGDLYVYDESKKADISTPVRRSFWSFRPKNSV